MREGGALRGVPDPPPLVVPEEGLVAEDDAAEAISSVEEVLDVEDCDELSDAGAVLFVPLVLEEGPKAGRGART